MTHGVGGSQEAAVRAVTVAVETKPKPGRSEERHSILVLGRQSVDIIVGR